MTTAQCFARTGNPDPDESMRPVIWPRTFRKLDRNGIWVFASVTSFNGQLSAGLSIDGTDVSIGWGWRLVTRPESINKIMDTWEEVGQ